MREKHINFFTGVMDQDTDPLLLKEGDYIDALDLVAGVSGMQQALENPKGNIEIDLDGSPLPSGNNTCIGAIEDRLSEAIYYFLHNDTDGHSIQRFIDLESDQYEVVPVASSPLFEFTKHNRIQGDIVDSKYLYWTNGRAERDRLTGELSITGGFPCKLNTVKAIRSNNFMECMLIPAQAREVDDGIQIFSNGNTYTFSLADETGNIFATLELGADGTYEGDPAGGLAWIKTQLEASELVDYISIEECGGCKLDVSSLFYNYELTLASSESDLLLVPIGYYPTTLDTHHFQLVKEPPTYPPDVEFTKDTSTAINTVQRRCFQFRVRYIYDDGEPSAWGPISVVALNLGVNGETVDDLNAIEIDFTDTRLGDPSWLCIIQKVEIAVRDGNDGIFKSIKTLDRCDLGLNRQVYVWTNDEEYAVVPSDDGSQGTSDTQVLKLYDDVPLVSASLVTAAGSEGDYRQFLGDNLEGYECPDCVEAEYEIVDNVVDGTVDIVGTVRVLEEDGGIEIDPDFLNLRLSGFVVYLAGTSYYGISNNPNEGGGDGAFIIKGVPRGKYLLRVASYACGFDNTFGTTLNLNNGLLWQKTSSPVIDCAGSFADTGIRTERVIDLSGFVGDIFDLDTEVGYGTVDIQNAYASQTDTLLVEIQVFDRGEDFSLDETNEANWVTFAEKVTESICVERIKVYANNDGINPTQSMFTDHNGYVFFLLETGASGFSFTIDGGMDDFAFGFANSYNTIWLALDEDKDYFYSNGAGVGSVDGAFLKPSVTYTGSSLHIVAMNTLASWTTSYRRLLSGSVIDLEGKGLSGVLVMYERCGRQEETDVFGNYVISIYPENDTGASVVRTDDRLFVTYPNDVSFIYPSSPSDQTPNIDPWDDYVASDFQFGFAGGLTINNRLFKNGAQYSWAILYEDAANRTCGAVSLDSIRIPFCTESGDIQKNRVLWSINSVPPIWATQYRLLRTKNLVHSRYFQWVTDEVKFAVVSNPSEAPTFVGFSAANWTHIFIRVNTKDVAGEEAALLLFYAEQKEGYTAMSGDRLRFMLDESSNPVVSGKILELDIIGRYIDGDNYYVVIPRIEFSALEPQAGWSFEFYTPKGVDEPFFYETGDCYPIIEPGTEDRRHGGQTQDQVVGVDPAQGYLTGGDTYWRYKSFNTVGAGVRFYTENATVSPFHTEACEDIGRAFTEATVGETWRFSRVRWSGIYVPNSRINGLSSFGSLDYVDIHRQFGPISALAYVSGQILALAWHRVQPLYLKQGEIMDIRGNIQIARSDEILSIADPSVSDSGCMHPESMAVYRNNVYWWDAYNGKPCRYSQAGVEPLTRGMFKTFNDIGNARKALSNEIDLVFGGYDRTNNFYLLTFPEATYVGGDGEVTLEANTYAFSELQNGWKTRFRFTPECYSALGMYLFSWRNGAPWRHLVNADRNNYYDTQYYSEIKFAVNPRPDSVKDWHCISLRTNNQWYGYSIEIPANLNYASGMRSRLAANKWKSYEGDLCADFLRDMNDTSGLILAIVDDTEREVTALLKGRPLKGHVLIITLRDVNTSEGVKIWHAITEYSASMKTGM